MTVEADEAATIVVAGAGGAGMTAAIAAADRGLDVLILEKDLGRISNTGICGGLVPGAGTRWQHAAGIDDSPERMAGDVMAKNGGRADPALVAMIAARSAGVIEFIERRLGLAIHLHTGILHPGLTRHRLHASPGETGAELVAALRAVVTRHPRIRLRDQVEVTGLVAAGTGVVGVEARMGGAMKRIAAQGVVLACCGFNANAEMVAQYCPDMAGAMNLGATTATGEGILAGMAIGAATAHMSGYQGHCHANPVEGTHLGGSLPRLGAIMVNRDGRRFGREDIGYSEFARVVLAQPGGRAVEVFDQRIHDLAMTLGPFREACEAGAVKRADTIAELAAAFDLPAEALAQEIATFNADVSRGGDRFGREVFGAPLAPPFYGSLVTGAMAHTQGGLRIDTRARVLRPDGSAIPGLYAAGGTAEGISGDGPEGYLSGNGLAHAFATGLAAGEAVTAPAT